MIYAPNCAQLAAVVAGDRDLVVKRAEQFHQRL